MSAEHLPGMEPAHKTNSERAAPSGRRLSAADASLVKGMLKRHDRQHDIASWFGVNSGRIMDVKHGELHPQAPVAPAEALPPPGPYSSGRAAQAAMSALVLAKDAIERAQASIDAVRAEIDAAKVAINSALDEIRNEKL